MSSQFSPDERNLPTASDVLCALVRERVLQEVDSRLRHSSYPQLWRIRCEYHEGVLTLRGVVGSYFMRQIASASVADVHGVEEVSDRLEVRNLQSVQMIFG